MPVALPDGSGSTGPVEPGSGPYPVAVQMPDVAGVRSLARAMRKAASDLGGVSDDAQQDVELHTGSWSGQSQQNFLSTWGNQITGVVAPPPMPAGLDFRAQRLWEADHQEQGVFSAAFPTITADLWTVADQLDSFASAVDQAQADDDKLAFNFLVSIMPVVIAVFTLDPLALLALGPETAGGLGLTAARIGIGAGVGAGLGFAQGAVQSLGDSVIQETEVDHQGFFQALTNPDNIVPALEAGGQAALGGALVGGVLGGAGALPGFLGAPAGQALASGLLGAGLTAAQEGRVNAGEDLTNFVLGSLLGVGGERGELPAVPDGQLGDPSLLFVKDPSGEVIGAGFTMDGRQFVNVDPIAGTVTGLGTLDAGPGGVRLSTEALAPATELRALPDGGDPLATSFTLADAEGNPIGTLTLQPGVGGGARLELELPGAGKGTLYGYELPGEGGARQALLFDEGNRLVGVAGVQGPGDAPGAASLRVALGTGETSTLRLPDGTVLGSASLGGAASGRPLAVTVTAPDGSTVFQGTLADFRRQFGDAAALRDLPGARVEVADAASGGRLAFTVTEDGQLVSEVRGGALHFAGGVTGLPESLRAEPEEGGVRALLSNDWRVQTYPAGDGRVTLVGPDGQAYRFVRGENGRLSPTLDATWREAPDQPVTAPGQTIDQGVDSGSGLEVGQYGSGTAYLTDGEVAGATSQRTAGIESQPAGVVDDSAQVGREMEVRGTPAPVDSGGPGSRRLRIVPAAHADTPSAVRDLTVRTTPVDEIPSAPPATSGSEVVSSSVSDVNARADLWERSRIPISAGGHFEESARITGGEGPRWGSIRGEGPVRRGLHGDGMSFGHSDGPVERPENGGQQQQPSKPQGDARRSVGEILSSIEPAGPVSVEAMRPNVGESVPPEAIQFIAFHSARYFAGGGEVEVIPGEAARRRFPVWTRQRDVSTESPRVREGRGMLEDALNWDFVVVAHHGDVLDAALGFNRRPDHLMVGSLGSAHTLESGGAATAAQLALAGEAAETGQRVLSEHTEDSVAYHRLLGRQLGPKTSVWSLGDARQIVNGAGELLFWSPAANEPSAATVGNPVSGEVLVAGAAIGAPADRLHVDPAIAQRFPGQHLLFFERVAPGDLEGAVARSLEARKDYPLTEVALVYTSTGTDGLVDLAVVMGSDSGRPWAEVVDAPAGHASPWHTESQSALTQDEITPQDIAALRDFAKATAPDSELGEDGHSYTAVIIYGDQARWVSVGSYLEGRHQFTHIGDPVPLATPGFVELIADQIRNTIDYDIEKHTLHQPGEPKRGDRPGQPHGWLRQAARRISGRSGPPIVDPWGRTLTGPESALAARQPISVQPLRGGASKLWFSDGTSGIAKPRSGEKPGLRKHIPAGQYWLRSILASRIAEILVETVGVFNEQPLVPTTIPLSMLRWDSKPAELEGEGSLQAWVDGTKSGFRDIRQYPLLFQQFVAVIDYGLANLDRNETNHRRNPNIALDHDLILPTADEGSTILSDFVVAWFKQPFGPEVLAALSRPGVIQRIDNEIRLFEPAGLAPAAREASIRRFIEVAREGMITGQAWRGEVKGSYLRLEEPEQVDPWAEGPDAKAAIGGDPPPFNEADGTPRVVQAESGFISPPAEAAAPSAEDAWMGTAAANPSNVVETAENVVREAVERLDAQRVEAMEGGTGNVELWQLPAWSDFERGVAMTRDAWRRYREAKLSPLLAQAVRFFDQEQARRLSVEGVESGRRSFVGPKDEPPTSASTTLPNRDGSHGTQELKRGPRPNGAATIGATDRWQVLTADEQTETHQWTHDNFTGHEAVKAQGRIPTSAERELAEKTPARIQALPQEGHLNQAFLVEFDDGSRGIFKPKSGERPTAKNIPLGQYWMREISFWRGNVVFGFRLVRPTVPWFVPRLGVGSLREWIDGAEPGLLDITGYSTVDLEQAAVLEYVFAMTDRKPSDYLTGRTNSLELTDNGFTAPEVPDAPIQSHFVFSYLGRKLSAQMIEDVRSVEPTALSGAMYPGISAAARESMEDRLIEIQEDGMISGRNWRGEIWGRPESITLPP